MTNKTHDERSKKDIANAVISGNRHYFVPGAGSVEASSPIEAVKKLKKKKAKAGDGNR